MMSCARNLHPILFLCLFSSHVKSSIFNICGHCVHLGMYRERNTDTRHVTGIIRPPITEFPILRPPSPSSPHFGPKGYLWKVSVFSLGDVTLSACTPYYR